MIMTEIMTTS